jgi:hypothetical protein
VALLFILPMILFRSVVIPATAAIMNLFSAAAAFGVIVAVFQFGWLDRLVGVTHTGPITPLVLLFPNGPWCISSARQAAPGGRASQAQHFERTAAGP